MAIACVYCGGAHPDAAGVRTCWERNGQPLEDRPDAAPPLPAPPRAASPASHASPTARPPAQAVDAAIRRGPAVLGRNVVVESDDDVPGDWADAPRRAITAATLADPSSLVTELRQLGHDRQGCVLVIGPDIADRLEQLAAEVDDRPLHEIGPRHTLHHEVLHHLVWSNSIDARGSGRWALVDHAVAAGARPVGSAEAGIARGDVVLRDGTAVWLDGGPIRHTLPIDGVPVLHRIVVERGSLRPFGEAPCTAELAPDQLAAVTHPGGAARIIAPAGSGKTRVLTERARHLIHAWDLPSEAVCVVAFNTRAAQEVRDRTADLPGLQVRTLNAIALAIVNGSRPFAPQPRQLRTLDEGDVRRIIGKLVTFPRRRNADPVANWIEALAAARLGLRDPDDVEAAYDGEVDGFAQVLPRYQAELSRAGAVDFDEQVHLALRLLLTDPPTRHAAQRACRVLLVDEFQDLTPAHVLLVRLLAGPDAAVFGVGDDDQTIYGYNGADPAWLIDFRSLFPGAGEHPLEVNYRCPGGIVMAADRLLRRNRRRVAKVIRADRPLEHGWSVDRGGDGVGSTVATVTDWLSGRPASDVAVLTRVNSLLAPVQAALVTAGTPVQGGVGPEFVDRTAVRSALAWLRLATGDGRFASDDLTEALRRPSRPLHPNVATWVTEQRSLEGLRRLAERVRTERDAERVGEFADDIERLQTLARDGATTATLLATLRDTVGLASAVATLDVHRRGMNRAAQSDDLTAIAQLARQHDDPATFERWLRGVFTRTRGDAGGADGVTLATVHRVKGQEWPCVVVHQAEADQFPHRLADDVEEERRLFHVAITRASEQVHIVVDRAPSPFVAELDTEPAATPEIVTSAARTAETAPRRAAAGRPGDALDGGDAALFEALRAWRRHAAAGKPAYTVLADATLADIAARRPRTLADLARIRGIGPTKLDLYGSAILVVVEDAG
jgi:DNA helicase-2/ATP-dependent DNA helicase PcrA